MTKKFWLAFDIGCIECGENSEVIGVFRTEQEAKLAAKNWHNGETFRGGQHYHEVFEIDVPIMLEDK